MEEILEKLLVADNNVLQQGTKELREAFTKPGVIILLCNVVVSSSNPQIRQYAALLLRKRLSKSKHWFKLSLDERNAVKQGILPALLNEKEKTVKSSIAQFIGSIMKHEISGNTWPELFQFVQQLNTSSNMQENELGIFTLDVLTDVSPRVFLKESTALCHLLRDIFKSALQQDLSSPVVYHGICILTNMTAVAEQDQALINLFHEAVPLCLQAIEVFASRDETKALKVMEYFDGLLDCVIQVIVPHIKIIIPAFLTIAKENTLGDDLRVKALSFVGEIVSKKKKAVTKHNLVKSILDVLFVIMSAPVKNGDQDECFSEDDSDTPLTCANQTLDILALNLPPEKIMPYVLEFIEHGLQSDNLHAKKASYLTMAVLVEGCSDYIRSKYLKQFLTCVCKGITDEASVVRNAALFALGQFSEHLQPEISEYAQELLPVLFQLLQQLCSDMKQKGEGFKDPPGVDKMFYALEMFCENLGEGLVPYLPTLMESLLIAMSPQNSVHMQELAISAVGATANAAKEEMIPFFQKIVDSLKIYLMEEQPSDKLCLQVQAVDTLGVLARAVGEETFRPISQESLQLGMTLLEKVNDPDLRKSVYGLLASVSTVIKSDITVVLPKVVEYMLNSLKSQEGIVTEFKEDEQNSAFPVYEDLSDSDDEEDIENESERSDDDSELACYNVENAYMEEKEEACLALGELALQTGVDFMPFMDQCFEEVLKMANFPFPDVRQSAIETLAQFCISLTSMKSERGEQAVLKALSVLVPKCSEVIHTDDDRDVVMSALDALGKLLSELKATVLIGEGHRDAIINCIRDVVTCKTECQDSDDPTNEDTDEEEEAEQDELLVQYAVNVVPQLGKAMTHEEFSEYFKTTLPMFLSKLKKQSTLSQRSFNIGVIAECMEPLGPFSAQYVHNLFPIIIQMTQDEHEEVRSNAIFGLGEFVMHAKEALYQNYPEILQVLSLAVTNEKDPTLLDNVCGALSRMILTNMNAVPIDEVFPVFIKHLPLRRDFEENQMVFRCLNALYQAGHKALLSNIVSILKLAMIVLYKGQYSNKETLECVVTLLTRIKHDFPSEFSSATSELSQKQLDTLTKRLNSISQ